MKRIDELVDLDESRVNVEVYTSEEIFRQELRDIWYKTWVYVGHESELKHPGDYKTSYIGLIPVILSRDEDGEIHGLINRCIHRGTTVCQSELGNSQFFRCEYHGWVYGNRGELLGTTMRNGYDPRELARIEKGLQRVPRLASYRGMIFGSMAEDGEDLIDHLGNAAYFIDRWADQSPEGELELTKGVWTHRFQANWKLQYEGSDEGYHPAHLHRVAMQSFAKMAEKTGWRHPGTQPERANATNLAADLLHGHSILGAGGGLLARDPEDVQPPQLSPLYPESYLESISNRLDGDAVKLADTFNDWRMAIFPNVAINRNNLRIIRPIGPALTEVKQWYVHAAGAPDEVNTAKVREEEFFYGPAGFGSPDDFECFERMQEGYKAGSWEGAYPWSWFNRQSMRSWSGPRGERCAEYSAEVEVFAMYHEWKKLMSAALESGS
ncbi:Rieske 2Fe-2S domain-containing protein [Streptomyces sp. Y7]|uniref:aromatic ring-hydroxylating oxygenase subunit alpha n=1 Tax=Streptomyces sp. Y7 TaxID=3342392 RepID=UPI00371A10D4